MATTKLPAKPRAPRPAAPPPDAGVPRAEIERILDVVRRWGDGDPSARAELEALQDPLAKQLGAAVNAAAARAGETQAAAHARMESVGHGLDAAIEALLKTVVQGDLSGDIRLSSADPTLSPLVTGVGQVLETLRRFVLEIREAVLQLSTGASEVLAAATQNESSMTEQASAVHETTATMEELKGASHQIADNAQTVAAIAERTLSGARTGEGAIRSFMDSMERVRRNASDVGSAMQKLSRSLERIGSVVDVIDEIADRSDLLALNAALEGAKAGEAGRGFSIVAAEMRRLAENVMESTKEIKTLISDIRQASTLANTSAERNVTMAAEGEKLGSSAIESVSGILSGVQETSDAARVIHLATQQQRTATEQVVQSMAEIEEITRQAQGGSRQATSAAAELTGLAERLSELVQRFKVE